MSLIIRLTNKVKAITSVIINKIAPIIRFVGLTIWVVPNVLLLKLLTAKIKPTAIEKGKIRSTILTHLGLGSAILGGESRRVYVYIRECTTAKMGEGVKEKSVNSVKKRIKNFMMKCFKN